LRIRERMRIRARRTTQRRLMEQNGTIMKCRSEMMMRNPKALAERCRRRVEVAFLVLF